MDYFDKLLLTVDGYNKKYPNGNTPFKVALFDVDGVLVNGEPFSTHLARDYGISTEKTAPFFRGRFLECLVGRADLKEELITYVPLWGWQGSADGFVDYWFRCEHNINEPLVHAVQQLRQQGIRCYMATNQEKYRTAYILEQMGLGEKFDGIFSSAYIGYMKHETAFFEHILQELNGIEAETIIFWDDSSGNIATAKKMGLRAELYHDFADFEEKMKRYLGA